MFEQRIYGRAGAGFRRWDGESVTIGYGVLAQSTSFSRFGPILNSMMTGDYPNGVSDVFGRAPGILVKRRFTLPDGREAQLLQQTSRVDSGGRRNSMVHQLVADADSVTDMVRRPDMWLAVHFAAEENNWATLRLPSLPMIPVSRQVQPAPFVNVLQFFGMSPATFVTLLCSLFDAICSPSVYTVVVFPDNVPNHEFWVRCLIMYIYYFMPFSMRRRLGFESWMTGTVDPAFCELYFVPERRMVRRGESWAAELNSSGGMAELKDAYLFWGDGYRHRRNSVLERETVEEQTPYRHFITPWVFETYRCRNAGAAVADRLNREYWEMLAAAPLGSADPDPMTGFAALEEYFVIKQDPKTSITFDSMGEKARSLYAGLGEPGAEAVASLIHRDITVNAEAWQSASDRLDELVDIVDSGDCGNAVVNEVCSIIANMLEHCPVRIDYFRAVFDLTTQGKLLPSENWWQALLERAVQEKRYVILAELAAGCPDTEQPPEAIRDAAGRCLKAILPERMPINEQLYTIAEPLKRCNDDGMLTRALLEHTAFSAQELISEADRMSAAFDRAGVQLRSRLLRATLPQRAEKLVELLKGLKQLPSLGDDEAMGALALRYASEATLSTDRAIDLSVQLRELLTTEDGFRVSEQLIKRVDGRTQAPERLMQTVSSFEEPLRVALLGRILSATERPIQLFDLLARAVSGKKEYYSVIVTRLKTVQPETALVEPLLGMLHSFSDSVGIRTVLRALLDSSMAMSCPNDSDMERILKLLQAVAPEDKPPILETLMSRVVLSERGLLRLSELTDVVYTAGMAYNAKRAVLDTLARSEQLTIRLLKAADRVIATLEEGHPEIAASLLRELLELLGNRIDQPETEQLPEYIECLKRRRGLADTMPIVVALSIRYGTTALQLDTMIALLSGSGMLEPVLSGVGALSDRPEALLQLAEKRCGALSPTERAAFAELLAASVSDRALDIDALQRLLRLGTGELLPLSEAQLVRVIEGAAVPKADSRPWSALLELLQLTGSDACRTAILQLADRAASAATIDRVDLVKMNNAYTEERAFLRDRILGCMLTYWKPANDEDVSWCLKNLIYEDRGALSELARQRIRRYLKAPDTSIRSAELPELMLTGRTSIDEELAGLMLERCAPEGRIVDMLLQIDTEQTALEQEHPALFACLRMRWGQLVDMLPVEQVLSCLTAQLQRAPENDLRPAVLYAALLRGARSDAWSDDMLEALRGLTRVLDPGMGTAVGSAEVILTAVRRLHDRYPEEEADIISEWLLRHLDPRIETNTPMLMEGLIALPESGEQKRLLHELLSLDAVRFQRMDRDRIVEWLRQLPTSELKLELLGKLREFFRYGMSQPHGLNVVLVELAQDRSGTPELREEAGKCLMDWYGGTLNPQRLVAELADRMECWNEQDRDRCAILAYKAVKERKTVEYTEMFCTAMRRRMPDEQKRMAYLICLLEWCMQVEAKSDETTALKCLRRMLKQSLSKPGSFEYILRAVKDAEGSEGYVHLIRALVLDWLEDERTQGICVQEILKRGDSALKSKLRGLGSYSEVYELWQNGFVRALCRAVFEPGADMQRLLRTEKPREDILLEWQTIAKKLFLFRSSEKIGFGVICESYLDFMACLARRNERFELHPIDPMQEPWSGYLAQADSDAVWVIVLQALLYRQTELDELPEALLQLDALIGRAEKAIDDEYMRLLCTKAVILVRRVTKVHLQMKASRFIQLLLWSQDEEQYRWLCSIMAKCSEGFSPKDVVEGWKCLRERYPEKVQRCFRAMGQLVQQADIMLRYPTLRNEWKKAVEAADNRG